MAAWLFTSWSISSWLLLAETPALRCGRAVTARPDGRIDNKRSLETMT
jgi:hypothetical protein